MEGFFYWFLNESNIYANIFTLLTVVVSGIVSLLISAHYYKKGNLTNLEMSVIQPLCNLLKEEYTKNNYSRVESISKEHSIRYMKKKERRVFLKLKDAYEKYTKTTEEFVCADALYSYFRNVIQEKGLDKKYVPIELDGEIMDYVSRFDLDEYLYTDLESICNRDPLDSWEDLEFYTGKKIDYLIEKKYKYYLKKYLSDEEISFFNDCSAEQVVRNSEQYKKWKQDLKELNDSKQNFLKLNICKMNNSYTLD